MKHVRMISHQPRQAEGPTTGQILAVIGQILGIIGAALVAKEAADTA
ncbi:MAG: hypothetical protein HYV26_18210 [Candidatus Hydrogenedentes bacterium]|nr:hypothetical protein [Candidatus Hydrogenedentota bacterium]MBI3117964.1 hypothetical protein [Candidatus Hydrogenedentota bacterium]